jgi:hypothetical protein
MVDDCSHDAGQEHTPVRTIKGLREKRIQIKERRGMVKVVRDGELETTLNAFPPPGHRSQNRCNSCGPEWESTHDAESCPLRELEITFLSADWFMLANEATS